jgi:hypothetical protein
MNCVYCEKPLECDVCGEPYNPKGLGEYQALSRLEIPIVCPGCGSILVCHWCKTPYDGEGEEGESGVG